MSYQFEARQIGTSFGAPWDVFDTATQEYLNRPGRFVDAIDTAREMNLTPNKRAAPTAPHCARCELLEAALVAISSCATEEPVRRRAEAALAIVARTAGGGDANG